MVARSTKKRETRFENPLILEGRTFIIRLGCIKGTCGNHVKIEKDEGHRHDDVIRMYKYV